MTTSSVGIFFTGCLPTGMPRPLSTTVTGVVRVDGHGDLGAEPGERLVDGVVNDLVDKVVQAARARRADVHARALAHRLEALEDFDFPGAVFVLVLLRHATVLPRSVTLVKTLYDIGPDESMIPL